MKRHNLGRFDCHQNQRFVMNKKGFAFKMFMYILNVIFLGILLVFMIIFLGVNIEYRTTPLEDHYIVDTITKCYKLDIESGTDLIDCIDERYSAKIVDNGKIVFINKKNYWAKTCGLDNLHVCFKTSKLFEGREIELNVIYKK